jgi:GNAT superfamily N-acetyltransferase
MALSAPQPLRPDHQIGDFDSGIGSLDDWLKRRAQSNQTARASRTFVVCDETRVAAYYALAAGAVDTKAAPGRFKRNMPDPIPVAILGRLAVSRAYQGQGLGRALVRDAVLRLLQASETLGIRGVLVHALSPEAKAFYIALGFEVSSLDPMMLMITLADAEANLGSASG